MSNILNKLAKFTFISVPWIGLLLSLSSLLMSLILIIISQLDARVALQSLEWPTTQGEVVHTEVITSHYTYTRGGQNRTRTSSSLVITYRYRVEGKEYTSQQFHIGPGGADAFSGSNPKNWGKKNYPTGKQIRVFYDPEKHEKAVLKPGVAAITFVLLAIGSLFTGLGYFFLRIYKQEYLPEEKRHSLLMIFLVSMIIVMTVAGINFLALPAKITGLQLL